METVKYLCEFFFCHFWHFLGLVIVLETIFGGFGAYLYVKLRDIAERNERFGK